MTDNSEIPTGRSGPDPDEWDDFVRRFEADRAGLGTGGSGQQPAPRTRRVWPRNLALALLAAGAAFAVLKYTGVAPGNGTAAPAPAAPTPAGATSAASATAPPSTAPPSAVSPRSTTAATAGARAVMPLVELFPEQVKGPSGAAFTRLGSRLMDSCTEPGGVGRRLAAMIEESAGCVGEQIALYKDDRNNQYNMAVFTMKDPQDTLRLVTELSMAFDDYQVAVQAPPPGSGLPALPADSGLVQAFTGHGRVMVVAMGQWSDGRTADFQQLVNRMTPLQDAVSGKVGAHEGTG
ncbi:MULTISPECIES: hypothetical protein [unclassified Streptomyces]|uniref:hypothetical protein n=1 Tax=unclassified Streptomyces TaxID=2593676 RepID=UPI002E35A514|nr:MULTISPECIES: hypothetical protein [unclassified Streptomyces]WUC68293.1 hypothetical protein OG861_30835 [Streptomyces sp. NBC_00539]